MDSLTELLLRKYQPDSPLLHELQEPAQALVSLDKSQASPAYSQAIKTSSEARQTVVCKSAAGTTTTMTVIMSADDYTDDEITFGCKTFNLLNPTSMSKSYQLPVAFEGIPAGSWVYVTPHKGP